MEESDYLKRAFALAKEALTCGEVPIGCVFVYKDQIIGRGRNTVNETHNASRHGEINAIDEVIAFVNKEKLNLTGVMNETCLYVNVEPCAMCADALHQIGLGKVVYGCSNDKFGGFGSVVDVPKLHPNIKINVVKGLRSEEAVDLLKQFYKGVNPQAPIDKVKTRNKEAKTIL